MIFIIYTSREGQGKLPPLTSQCVFVTFTTDKNDNNLVTKRNNDAHKKIHYRNFQNILSSSDMAQDFKHL